MINQKHGLQLETTFVIGIGEDVKDILCNAQEVLLEKRICNIGFSSCEVVHNLEAH